MAPHTSRIALKKLTIEGTDFYLHPGTLQVFRAEGSIAAAIIDAVCQGGPLPRIISRLREEHGTAAVDQVAQEVQQFLLRLGSRSPKRSEPAARLTSSRPSKWLSLEVTSACNLRCTYCYQPTSWRHARMAWDIGKRCIDLLQKGSTGGETWHISFYGGEPLLNISLVMRVADYATSVARRVGCGVRFRITTNGTLVNERIAREFARRRFQVELSLDGRGASHDRHRRTASGAGTHATIVARLPVLLRHIPSDLLTVNVVVTHETVNELERNLEYLWNLGLTRVVVIPVKLPWHSSQALNETDAHSLACLFEGLIHKYSGGMVDDDHPAWWTVWKYWHCVDASDPKHYRCPAGEDAYYVNSSGVIYPCDRFYYLGRYALGDVWRGIDEHSHARWLKDRPTVEECPRCRDCWARYYCGGGCYALALETNNDLRMPDDSDCLVRRALIESALKTRLQLTHYRAPREALVGDTEK